MIDKKKKSQKLKNNLLYTNLIFTQKSLCDTDILLSAMIPENEMEQFDWFTNGPMLLKWDMIMKWHPTKLTAPFPPSLFFQQNNSAYIFYSFLLNRNHLIIHTLTENGRLSFILYTIFRLYSQGGLDGKVGQMSFSVSSLVRG